MQHHTSIHTLQDFLDPNRYQETKETHAFGTHSILKDREFFAQWVPFAYQEGYWVYVDLAPNEAGKQGGAAASNTGDIQVESSE